MNLVSFQRWITSSVCFFAIAIAVVAADEIDGPSGGQIDSAVISQDDILDWIDDLSAPNRLVRVEAEQSLIDAGPKWFSSLPDITDEMPIETRQRLQRVIEAYQRTKDENAVAIESIEIDLHATKTLGEALEAISRQSGIEFEHPVEDSRAITPTPGRLPFWHAVDYVLDQSGLDVNLYGGSRDTISLVPRADERPSRVDSAAYAGNYRLEPTTISATRAIRTPSLSGLNLTLEVSWIPGRTPVGLIVPVGDMTGTLDDGKTLRPQLSARTIDVATTAEVSASDFYLPLQLPSTSAQRIKSIAGTLSAMMPGPTHSFEIPLDQISVSFVQNEMSVSIQRIRQDAALHSIQISANLELPSEAMESHRQWLVQNEAYVMMADGTRRDHLGFEVFNQNSGGITIGYLFDLDGVQSPSGTFVYRSPTSLTRQDVTFVINEITLP